MSCPDCFRGHIHDGTPKGRVEKLYGRDSYVTEPPEGVEPKGIVVILSDGCGWSFVNTRLLADQFASDGPFVVYLPDFLGAHAVPTWVIGPMTRLTTEGGILGWLWKPWYLAQTVAAMLPMIKFSIFNDPWPEIKAYLIAIRQNEDRKLPIGVAGYCWGGTYAVRLVHQESANEADGQALVDVAFAAHPGAMVVPGDAEKVARPLSFAIGDRDALLPMTQVSVVKEVLEGKKSKGEVDTEVVVYSGAKHGFGTRGDPTDAEGLKHSTSATTQAISWFSSHFSE